MLRDIHGSSPLQTGVLDHPRPTPPSDVLLFLSVSPLLLCPPSPLPCPHSHTFHQFLETEGATTWPVRRDLPGCALRWGL